MSNSYINVDNEHLQLKIDDAIRIATQYSDGFFIRSLFSGGKDSIVSTHIVSHLPNFRGISHVRTGTGPDAERHSDKAVGFADAMGWHVLEQRPFTTYEMLITKFGFPGPAQHPMFYQYLKGRTIDHLTKQARSIKKSNRNIAYMTGIRRSESKKRMKYSESRDRTKSERWVCPIINWNLEDVFEYMSIFGLEANKGESSECHCGAMATKDERELIALRSPDQKIYWDMLEARVELIRKQELWEASIGIRESDKVIQERFCKWGHGMRAGEVIEQTNDDYFTICNTCETNLAMDETGNTGYDPDIALYLHRQRVEEINAQIELEKNNV